MYIVSQEWEEVEIHKTKNNKNNTESTKPNINISTAGIQTLTPCVRLLILNRRLIQGWTITDLAHRIGESPEKVKNYEKGIDFPDSNALKKLQDVLEVKLVPI